MQYSSHGGGCCGIQHLSGFTAREPERVERELDQRIVEHEITQDGRMLEAVLTDNQLRQPFIADILAARGFRLVSRFRNSNSGNYCNVFHRHLRFEDLNQAPGWAGSTARPIQITTPTRSMPQYAVDPTLPIEFVGGPRAIVVAYDGGHNISLRAAESFRNPGGAGYDLSSTFTYSLLDGTWVGNPLNGRVRNVPNPLLTTYHNVFRDGRVGPGFDTLEEAIASAPRCAVRRRRDLMPGETEPIWSADNELDNPAQPPAPPAPRRYTSRDEIRNGDRVRYQGRNGNPLNGREGTVTNVRDGYRNLDVRFEGYGPAVIGSWGNLELLARPGEE